ncbi:angiopoietin-like protein 8 [Brachionichthys hirsutus]|uniref:angiopoietin-like protein 8 n=1 Tax=Brachionichthys hirsutus TaxID=412623 RepID=UPI0036043B2F
MIRGLCLLFLAGGLRAVHAGPVWKPLKIEDKFSTQEEINLLIFGVLQFSESLNHIYETTEAKLAKIRQAVKNHEATLQNLERETEQAAEVEKQMKEVIQLLQEHLTEQWAQTKTMKDQMAILEQEDEELKMKMERLEMYLNNSVPTSVKELQERAQEHSDVLKGLQHLVQFHKENIETQSNQLTKLQNMSEGVA